MYRVTLTTEQLAELNRRCRDPKTKPRTRDRLEMLRLSHAGWSIPRIAGHLGLTQSRVRHWVRAFLCGGFEALESKKSPGPPRKLTKAILEHLEQAVRQAGQEEGRTWTAPQVMGWLKDNYGLSVNRTYLCEVLNRHGLSYKRTTRTLRHKQKPEQVAAKRADLETLKKGPPPG